MTIIVRKNTGLGGSEDTVVYRDLEQKTSAELTSESANIAFALTRKQHDPAQLTVRKAAVDAELATR